jgi:hypothetical protein
LGWFAATVFEIVFAAPLAKPVAHDGSVVVLLCFVLFFPTA